MSDETNDHPCFRCARNGEGGATYDFPHPALICVVDNHRSLDILGDLKICLDGLYRKCPKKNEELEEYIKENAKLREMYVNDE